MSHVSYYISQLFDDNLSIEQFEYKIVNFVDLLNRLTEHQDTIRVPLDLYENRLVGSITVSEYLFKPEHASDARELLFETITKLGTESIEFRELYELLDSKSNDSYKALAGMTENKYINEQQLYVNHETQMLFPYRYYLGKSITLDGFKMMYKKCFPALAFHERTSGTLNAFHNITEHSKELIRHLSVLNDYVKDLYTETGGDNEEVFRILKSRFDIYSSGRGSNEGLNNFRCSFPNSRKVLEEVRFNPHTKLYTEYSDFRIYFNWGRESIENGKILIGHIGGHWN
jgi:hypothetical protein